MNALFIYLLKSSVCLGLLFLVYWIFLRRETFFNLNRFYLLCSGFLSLLIPVIPFHGIMQERVSSLVIFLNSVLVQPGTFQSGIHSDALVAGIPAVIYFTGVILALAWFFARIMKLFFLVQKSKIRKEQDHILVLFDINFSPFSFFNLVFINERSVVRGNLETILVHEHVHIKQFHTLDLLLSELLIIFQWFNPFAWLISHELKTLHEYLADEGVIREGIPVPVYQQMVLNETMGIQVNNLANNFNISRLKNRFIMMTKSRSGSWSMSKALLALPVIIAAGLFFSASTGSLDNKQEKSKSEPQAKTMVAADEQPSYPGGQDAMIAFMLKNIRYPEEAKKAGAQGTVFITFAVETDGSLRSVKILRGFRNDCDKEALRVVKLMPNWNPAMMKGKPVKANITLPVKFALGEGKSEEKKK